MMIKAKFNELKLPIILLSEIVLCLLLGDQITPGMKSFFYATSLMIKEVLLMVLPFIIFSFLLGSLSELRKGAVAFTLLAFMMVICSNFISTAFAGFLGLISLDTMYSIAQVQAATNALEPLWHFNTPSIISNDFALFLGIAVGIAMTFFDTAEKPRQIAQYVRSIAVLCLKRAFIPIVPMFILGFILKMQHDGVLDIVVKDYLSILVLIVLCAFSYIIFLYGLATRFKGVQWRAVIKNMLPAMMTGFSTMSSASALPLITEAAHKNTNDSRTGAVVPISINIHLIGDCFALPILALAIMLSFGVPLPSIQDFLIFICFFVLAKFAVAAVPGGGVFVMLPIFEKYLSFSGEMLSLIVALYILFDALITSSNVMGNGAFAMLFTKLYRYLNITREPEHGSDFIEKTS